MHRTKYLIFAIFFISLNTLASSVDSLNYGAFGKVKIYHPEGNPKAVVLFVSGDGGWNSGVVDMARNIVRQDAMVVGIDIRKYFTGINNSKAKCSYPAGDFESLSLMIQKKYHLTEYLKPILVGYSSGATLVYGILAQAPANTFKGAISLGFCADIEINKTLCNGTGLTTHVLKEGKSYYLEPSEKLTAPFIVLHGMIDSVCSYHNTEKYMKGMHLGELITLPKVGHGFSVQANWLPQFITAFKKILQEPSYAQQKATQNTLLQTQHLIPLPSDLPVTLVPSSGNDSLPLAFLISGDGGWTSFDQNVAESFAEKGMPVIGLDAQKYFWDARTPEQATTDITIAVEHYMQQWHRGTFILAGYSFGADVVPFVANRLSPLLKEKLLAVCSLSPDEKGDFEIHLSDMLSFGNNNYDTYDVITEIKKIRSLHPVCIFGEEEDAATRNNFIEAGLKVELLPGNHHYNNNFSGIADTIGKFIYKP